MGWMKSIEKNRWLHSEEELREILWLAEAYGIPVSATPRDLTGHRGTGWDIPHIHVGERRFHIPVPSGFRLQ